MNRLNILTAGESHGQGLVGILEGMPSGVSIEEEKINAQLKRRQQGYGRGGRMKIETDRVQVMSGLRFGKTLGSPIGVVIHNKDWENWETRMNPWQGEETNPVQVPRPGHADLAGAVKYDHSDIRNILERASARETAMRVALGSIVRQMLEPFGITFYSQVIQISRARTEQTFLNVCQEENSDWAGSIQKLGDKTESSEVRCSDQSTEKAMIDQIEAAKQAGDTVGGIFEVAALGVPVGLGSHVFWDRRLDAQIASLLMGIPAMKGVEIGAGMETGKLPGSKIHDPMYPSEDQRVRYGSNQAGGIEGGISNGNPIIARVAMKPIPTLIQPLPSVHMKTGEAVMAHKERSDVCAVPAACVVAEAMLAIAIGTAFCERFGGDSLTQMQAHFNANTSK